MPSTVALPSPRDQHPSLIYDHHSEFGDYIYSSTTTSWTQRRALTNGKPLLLCGRGRRPSTEQIALFGEIDARLAELTTTAIAAVCQPPIKPRRGLFSRTPEFSQDELALREVRIEEDGSYEFFFDTPTGDKIHMWPVVTFSGWRVVECDWAC